MEFLQVLSFILMFISFALIGWMILTFSKVRTVSTRSPLIAMGMSLVFILVYLLIIGTSLPGGALLLILLLGAGLGAWQGQNTKVWTENGIGKAQNTVWFLVIWAVCYGFNQLLVSLGLAMSLNVGIGAMCLGTGVIFGSQGNILYRLSSMSTITPAEGEVAEPVHVRPSIPEPPTTDASKIRYCRKCGFPITAADRYCRKCGAEIQTKPQKSG
ncbi:MAG: zinc ribbon domain-containing protein [Proteobacteria bacterium]|nr:zinc ribbon domain-containing protein [Pseudomonadota bacterium]